MRNIPLWMARKLGKGTRVWRGFPLLYIFIMFFCVPLVLLGLSLMFEQDSKGLTTLGSFLVVLIALGLIYTAYWCKYQDGAEKCATNFKKREFRRTTVQELPEDMQYLKAKMRALIEHTGLPDDAGEEEIAAAIPGGMGEDATITVDKEVAEPEVEEEMMA